MFRASPRSLQTRLPVWFALCTIAFVLAARDGAAEELKLFFGLMHSHTKFSDGSGTPDEAFTMARAAGVHFFAVTEHNHNEAAGSDGIFLTPALYNDLKNSAHMHTVDGQFLAIYGQEFSTISKGNHVNLFWASEICNVPHGKFKQLYEEWLPDHPEVPFIQFNHPNASQDQDSSTPANERNNDYGIDDYAGNFNSLVAASGRYVGLCEMINGPANSVATNKPHQPGSHENDYLFYLNKGFKLAPSVGQDNHNKTWGVSTHARMGVWATELTETGIKTAIAERCSYASEDEDIQVKFEVNGKLMGSVIPAGPSSSVTLKVQVKDPSEPMAKHKVAIFFDNAVGGALATAVDTVTLNAGQTEASFTHVAQPGGYFFAKITQESDHPDRVWTAPVWIVGDVTPAFAALAPANTDDPAQDEIHWSNAANNIGREVTVTGKLIRSFSDDEALFCNFDPDFENTLSLVVLKSELAAFGGADALQQKLMNKSVRVKGKISLYKDYRLQLRLSDPAQIVEAEEIEAAPSDDVLTEMLSGFELIEDPRMPRIAMLAEHGKWWSGRPAMGEIKYAMATTKFPGPYHTVKLFYGTDRNRTGKTKAGEFYGKARGALEMGTCLVSIPLDHKSGKVERPSIWKMQFGEDPTRDVTLLDVSPQTPTNFSSELKIAVDDKKNDSKSIFVFVHGFNVSFEEAAWRTGQMAYDLEFTGVPLFFTWPSQSELTKAGYIADMQMTDFASEHLLNFLLHVKQNSGAKQIHIVAHSMGNKLLVSALARLKEMPANPVKLNQVVLTAPDIDSEIFKRDHVERLVSLADRVTLYASSRDLALYRARVYAGEYQRLGETIPTISILKGVESIDASAVDTSLVGHFYYGDNRSVLADMFYILRDGKAASGRFHCKPQGADPERYWILAP